VYLGECGICSTFNIAYLLHFRLLWWQPWEKWSMGIKIVREKKVKDYTFTDEMLNLSQPAKSEAVAKKEKAEPDFRLRDSAKVNKLKKSKITGGHSMQGHSPVYE
jgi:hypothetical protein